MPWAWRAAREPRARTPERGLTAKQLGVPDPGERLGERLRDASGMEIPRRIGLPLMPPRWWR